MSSSLVIDRIGKLAFTALAAAALSGCAVSAYCEGEQDYQAALSVPPLQPAEGMKLPESPSALKIPPPPAQIVGYGERFKDAEGEEQVRCLDKPPDIVQATAPAAAPASSAPAATPSTTAPSGTAPASTGTVPPPKPAPRPSDMPSTPVPADSK